MTFNEYEDREREMLRKIFTKNNISTYSFNNHTSYNPYDATIEKAGKTYIVEMKCRNFESTKYNTAIIDKYKIDNLLKYDNSIVIFHFTDGLAYVFSTKEIVKHKIITKTANVKTAIENPIKAEKQFYEIPIKRGKRIL